MAVVAAVVVAAGDVDVVAAAVASHQQSPPLDEQHHRVKFGPIFAAAHQISIIYPSWGQHTARWTKMVSLFYPVVGIPSEVVGFAAAP